MKTVKQVQNAIILVPLQGGSLRLVDPIDKAEMEIGLTAGKYNAKTILKELPSTWGIEPQNGVTILVQDERRAKPIKMGSVATQTGANPDFRPTSATAKEIELRRMMNKINAAEKRLDQRFKSLENVAKKTADNKQDEIDLIEPEPQPTVETTGNQEQPTVE